MYVPSGRASFPQNKNVCGIEAMLQVQWGRSAQSCVSEHDPLCKRRGRDLPSGAVVTDTGCSGEDLPFSKVVTDTGSSGGGDLPFGTVVTDTGSSVGGTYPLAK